MAHVTSEEGLDLLILRAKVGDLDAFEVIVRRFQDMAVGYAYSVLGDFHLAQDAAQEAFVEAYRDLTRVYGAEVFSTWLRKIVYKRCDRVLRKRQPELVDPVQVDSLPLEEKSPLEVLEEKETQNLVWSAIHSLPEEERRVTTLYHMAGYSYGEIGAFLGLSTSTVDNRLRSSRKRLRAKMLTMVREALPASRPSRDDRFTQKVQVFNAVEATDMDRIKQLLSTDAAREALYEFLKARAAEEGQTVEELVVQVVQQYKDKSERDYEETRVFREAVSSQEKQEALHEIEAYLSQATFHQGSILEMARLIPEAKHNATSIARCAWLASKFGYHTGSIFRIAQHASRSESERPELSTLAELAVRKLSETQRMVQLAESAADPLTAEEQEQLTEEIAHLDASADFNTLDEALEWQAAQGWAQAESRLPSE